MTTLADKAILSGADNRPPMLEKDMYDSWKSRMELYMMNIQHGQMILESVENGPLIWPTIEENRVYALVSNHRITKELWERIQLLMQGTSLTKQERECKLYDEFDKFAYKKGETLRDFYLRFSLLLNDMNIYNVKLEQFQVNTKFLNTLPPEWSKFVTDVKLVRDLHTTNIDQLHAYLGQHEFHANEVFHHNVYSPPSSIPQLEYAPTVNQQQQQHEFPQLDLGLTVPVFKKGDDPIDAINHMMSFLSAVVTSRYPTTNNQLRNSSNPRQQATINDGRVTLQPVQGRQIYFATGTSRTYTPRASRSYYGKQRTVIYAYDSDRDELNTAKVAIMANLSYYGSDALAKVHNPNNVDNNMLNQGVQVMPSSEQSNVVNQLETEITSDSNIIPYSQYVTESQQAASVEIDRLKQTLLENLKEKESLMQTVTLLKNDFKKEESRNIDREIALEKKIKQMDNIVFKRDQSVQTKAQQLEPKLYDDNVIKNTSAIVIPYSKETLNSMNSSYPNPSDRPTKVEVPKELPKVSMSQEKDTVIKKLKERIKSLSENMNKDKVKKDIKEMETINIELDHMVSKLIAENEHLKQTYKQLYDSIKPTQIRSKEQCDALVSQVNQKSIEISDLNVSLQEKDLVITALKNELRKHKGKDLVDNVVTKFPIAPEILKIDVEPINPRLLNNRTTHFDYLKHTQE
ncbi:hypothetical protein Tco_0264739 [Tanacetum coccineum]